MRYFYFPFLLLFYNIALCQTVHKLDESNGFKKFKFGMASSQFENTLKEKTSSLPLKEVKKYEYTGTDISFLHGVKIESIELAFFKNKLYMVGVNFGSLSKEYSVGEKNTLIYGLKSNFGNDTHDCRNPSKTDSNVLDCTIWDGRKVRLEHIRANFSNPEKAEETKSNSIMGYLLFTDKKLQKEQQNIELEN